MPKRVMQGRAMRDAKDKTVSVLVERSVKHPLYQKFVKQSKKYLAHDEQNVVPVEQHIVLFHDDVLLRAAVRTVSL